MLNTIPDITEQLLKLKAAFEDGKREDVLNTNTNAQGKGDRQSEPQKKTDRNDSHTQQRTSTNDLSGASVINRTKEEALHVKGGIVPKRIPLGKNKRVLAAGVWLTRTFPHLFTQQHPVPLKLGIINDIKAWLEAQCLSAHQAEESTSDLVSESSACDEPLKTRIDAVPTKRAIRDAITVYVNRLSYQRALCEQEVRYDLAGNPVGSVDEIQKEHARQRCAAIEASRQVRMDKRRAYRERRARSDA